MSDSLFCHSCPLGKHIKLPFSDSSSYTSLPFDLIHSDVWTSPMLSSYGHHYYVFFLDDYTNFQWTFPISHKSKVRDLFISFHTFVKTQFERDIKCFQCDNGREYDNGPFRSYFDQHGIVFCFSCPHTSP